MPRKEVHYFDRKIKDTESFDDRWYASLFEPGKGKTIGEYTPSYSILDRNMVSHVYELAPEARIIFLMRNPIERAWSQAVMRRTNKGYAVDKRSEKRFHRRFIRRASQVQTGSQLRTDYWRTLENWGVYYPPEQIFVGFLEDIGLHPEDFLRSVCEFLGVDTFFRPPTMDKKVYSRSTDEMPTRVAVHLARTYLEDTRRLEERFGGYASFWRYCAERLAEDPPAGDSITYPLWNSYLREGWTESAEGTPEVFGQGYLQSGILSLIQALR